MRVRRWKLASLIGKTAAGISGNMEPSTYLLPFPDIPYDDIFQGGYICGLAICVEDRPGRI
jgi:hypothetical protein